MKGAMGKTLCGGMNFGVQMGSFSNSNNGEV